MMMAYVISPMKLVTLSRLLLCLELLSGCAKEHSCENCKPPAPPVQPPEYVDPFVYSDFTVDGQRVFIQEGINGAVSTPGWINGPVFCIDNIFLNGLGNVEEKPYFNFMQGKFVFADFDARNFYVIGEYPFLTFDPDPLACCPCSMLTAGVGLNYRDTLGVWWSTYHGTGDQSGSSFRITGQEGDAPDLFIRASFECNLYNYNGDRKVMKGEFRLKVW